MPVVAPSKSKIRSAYRHWLTVSALSKYWAKTQPVTQSPPLTLHRLPAATHSDNHFLLPDISLSTRVRTSSFLGIERRQRSDHELIRPGLVNIIGNPLTISDISNRQPVQNRQADGLSQRQRFIEFGDDAAGQAHHLVAMVGGFHHLRLVDG